MEDIKIPLYTFTHPITGQIFQEYRPMSRSDQDFTAPDGVVCKKDITAPLYVGLGDKSMQVWQADPQYVKKCNPKRVKLKNGKSVKYDPSSMCDSGRSRTTQKQALPETGTQGKQIYINGAWYKWNSKKEKWTKVK